MFGCLGRKIDFSSEGELKKRPIFEWDVGATFKEVEESGVIKRSVSSVAFEKMLTLPKRTLLK